MKRFIIYKKNEDGTYGEKLGSYDTLQVREISENGSYPMSEPVASHFEMPAGLDEDCCVLNVVEGSDPIRYVVEEDAGLVALKAAATAIANVQNALSAAKAFGEQIMNEFTVENIMLGITADNMTGTVRKNMSEVIIALQTGSLYDAITEAKAIPIEDKDMKYITDARLLSFVNKIETELGIALSISL